MVTIIPEKEYRKGLKNRLVRYYFYIQQGLGLINEFRYLLMAILGAYYALKLSNPLIIPIMFFLSCLVLIFLGWLYVHHMKKIMEYITIEYATHWGRYQFELFEKIIQLLEDIKKERK